jgi:putative transposase
LLKDDYYKEIISDSLAWLFEERRCTILGFVIMPNHIHLLWKMGDGYARAQVQGVLLSSTAHRFKEHLKKTNRSALADYFVGYSDRTYGFWERDSLVKECWSEPFLLQKLTYIHQNPCQPHWRLANIPEDYFWSSARFYLEGTSSFHWLKHFAE